jgi:hypothetical protein
MSAATTPAAGDVRRRTVAGRPDVKSAYSIVSGARMTAATRQRPSICRRNTVVSPASIALHPFWKLRPSPGVTTPSPQPETTARSCAGSIAMPVSASRIAAGDAPRSTPALRVSTRVALPPSATSTKNGLPPKLTRGNPSSRSRSGSAKPASTRALSFVPPARPESASEAVIVRIARHSATASV